MTVETSADESLRERLLRDIALWQADGLIAPATAATLRERYNLSGFGLGQVLRYLGLSGLIFIVTGILGLIGALADSLIVAALLLLLVGAGFGAAGIVYSRDRLGRYGWSSKMALAIGVISASAAVLALLHAFDVGGSRLVFVGGWLILPLIVTLAYRFHITFLLVLGLVEFFHWVGSWTTMWGRGTYALEVQDPRLMAVAAIAVVGVGIWHERALAEKTGRFFAAYESMGLVYFNLSLLILSIDSPGAAAPWIAVFTVAAIGQILLGAWLGNSIVLGFGVTFAFIDGFTRFYERFWDTWEKGAFFLALGLLTFAAGAACEFALRQKRADA